VKLNSRDQVYKTTTQPPKIFICSEALRLSPRSAPSQKDPFILPHSKIVRTLEPTVEAEPISDTLNWSTSTLEIN